MEQLTGLDATFLYLETPSLHMHVSMAGDLRPVHRPGRVLLRQAARPGRAPDWSWPRSSVGDWSRSHSAWATPTGSTTRHSTSSTTYAARRVPAPGGVEELARFVGDVCSRQLDRSKPLWEMYIVEGLRGGQIAVVTKIHHCTIDGVSGAELLSQLFDLEPRPPARPGADNVVSVDERLPSDLQLLAQSLGTRLTRPLGMTRLAWRTGRALLDVRRVRARGLRTGRLAAHHAAHVAERGHHPTPTCGLLVHRASTTPNASERAVTRRSTTWSSPCAPAPCDGTSSTATSCPTSLSWRPSRSRPPRRWPTNAAPTRCQRCSWPCRARSTTRSRGCMPSGRAPRGPRRSTTPSVPTCCSTGRSTPPRTSSRRRRAPTRG